MTDVPNGERGEQRERDVRGSGPPRSSRTPRAAAGKTAGAGAAGKTARGARRRAEILDVAAHLFAQRGYRGVATAEIAQQIGITEPALFYYFPTKTALLQAVIEQRDADSREIVADLAALGGLAAIEGMPGFARRNQADPHLVRLFAVLVAENLDPDDPAHEQLAERYRRLRHAIADMIRRAQAAGEMRRDVDPHAKSVEIVAFIDGLHTQWLLDPADIDLVAMVEAYARELVLELRVSVL
ncbi:TetR/AcrR family transcriptional regulator [Catenulispora pinisilvae]|uniref:TetR/AcrR family transcriptional regulator n=1 Tax=Catenulispora pinisilvae TaxID=2705253 RepID=UPI0018915770|nr:TetR/AcrR family transcriptional regulator [Catenulispora pinisilvae]